MGQRENEIAKDLGITPTRVYQIVNSPLFQLELKRQLRKRYSRISKIEETIIDASEVGAKLFTLYPTPTSLSPFVSKRGIRH
jgi:hypothetical protein